MPLPTSLADMSTIVNSSPQVYPPAAYNAVGSVANPESGTYYRHFEFETLNWITNGSNSPYPTSDYVKYSALLGGVADSAARRSGNTLTYSGTYGDHLLYAAIKVNLTLSTINQSPSEGLAAKSAWEAYLRGLLASFPIALQSVLVSTPESQTWSWLQETQNTVQNIFRGLALSLMFQFVVTTLATRNWVLGALAALTSLWVVFVVLGIISFCGWSLGVIESVILVLVVPLAALQSTAMVLSFHQAVSDSRKERLRQCLFDCGASAMFVSIAGLGMSVFLFGSLLSFAFKYGVVFFVTSILSGAFSLVFLAATLGVGGPRRGQGRVWPASFERQSAAATLPDSTRASQSLALSPQATDAEADAAASWLRSNADPGAA